MKDKVILLHVVKFNDSDLILSCLNKEDHFYSLKARGALKSKKRFSGGLLEPMNYVEISYQESKTQAMGVLNEALLLEGFDDIRKSYERIELGLKLVSDILFIKRQASHIGLDEGHSFYLLGHALRAISKGYSIVSIRILFLAKLLFDQGILDVQGVGGSELKKIIKLRFQDLGNNLSKNLGPESDNGLMQKLERQLAEYFSKQKK